MLRLSEGELNWLCERLLPVEKSPKGRRPTVALRRVVAGIFWMLNNGAKWKGLPAEFGSKSTAHRRVKKWVEAGVLEAILRDAGRCVEERGQYRLCECFINATFSKARGGGDGIGLTKVGKCVKIMVLVDARGLPVAVETAPAKGAESHLVQQLFDFMLPSTVPKRLVGDKAYDSDALDAQVAALGSVMIAPHRSNRLPENKSQGGQRLSMTCSGQLSSLTGTI